MYASHTAGNSILADGGVTELDFRKRDDEKLSHASVWFPSSSRCRRQLETGAHFSGQIVSSDLASTRHVHGRAISHFRVPGCGAARVPL